MASREARSIHILDAISRRLMGSLSPTTFLKAVRGASPGMTLAQVVAHYNGQQKATVAVVVAKNPKKARKAAERENPDMTPQQQTADVDEKSYRAAARHWAKSLTDHEVSDLLSNNRHMQKWILVVSELITKKHGHRQSGTASLVARIALRDAFDARVEKPLGTNPGDIHIEHAAYQERCAGMTVAALRHTIADAQAAIKAHPTGHKAGYYADEVNYCSMELAKRDPVQRARMAKMQAEYEKTRKLGKNPKTLSGIASDGTKYVVKKDRDWNEWQVIAYVGGKRHEGRTYFACDGGAQGKEDAIATFQHLMRTTRK